MSLSQPEKNSKEQKDSSSLILFLLNMTSFGVHAATAPQPILDCIQCLEYINVELKIIFLLTDF